MRPQEPRAGFLLRMRRTPMTRCYCVCLERGQERTEIDGLSLDQALQIAQDGASRSPHDIFIERVHRTHRSLIAIFRSLACS